MKLNKCLPLLLLSLCFTVGCNTAAPLAKTDYVTFAKVKQIPQKYTLFQQSWFDYPELSKYKKIYIAPVTNKPIVLNNFWNKDVRFQSVLDEKADYEKYEKYLANAFKDAIKKDKQWQLAAKPGPGILKLQLYVNQLEPQNPFLGTLYNVTTFTPIGLVTLPLKTAACTYWEVGPAAAIEAYLTVPETSEIIAIIADRKKGRVALFNSRSFSSYSPLRQLADIWANDFVKMLANSRHKRLEKDPVFIWFQ
ncbi:MAG: DUF3313 domain-containing protein [Lentisphaerae bacterium]|nr:DUF3313 domain-containing protein [Lentisphaerota bacterium]MCP4103497.1 DUF3313 domain-containing protein [Lentisphaerota bacterium]